MNPLALYGANERQYNEATLYPGLHLARVIASSEDICRIATYEAECLAEVSGKFRQSAVLPAQFPAVGDYVMADRTNDVHGHAILHQVLTRKSLVLRGAAGGGKYAQVIAANVDVLFLCMSLNADFNLRRLERYLSIAYGSGATPVVALTKSDLAEDLATALALIERTAPGTDVAVTSSFDDDASYKALLPYLSPGVTASFIGSSGVGKSTLINRLCGETVQTTFDIRSDGKGRHTTTRREMLPLPCGAVVIDTPGMRELSVESVDLSKSFADIDALAEHCRFFDCTHGSEPGCAVREAIARGELTEARLNNYQKLKREARYDGLSGKKRENEKLSAMFESVGGMKNVRKYIRQTDKRKGR